MADRSVPIPPQVAEPRAAQRSGRRAQAGSGSGSGGQASSVVRSSLELVFSYSRSQQRFNGGLPSAPSFVDYQWSQDDAESDPEYTGEWDETASQASSADEGALIDDSVSSDASAFFPDDPVQRRGSNSGSTLPVVLEGAECDELTTPTESKNPSISAASGQTHAGTFASSSTPRTVPLPLPGRPGGVLRSFGTTPSVPLSSSQTSSNESAKTPRQQVRHLPDEPKAKGRSWAIHKKISDAESGPEMASLNVGPGPTERTPLLEPGYSPVHSTRTVASKKSWAPDRLVLSAPSSRRPSRSTPRRPSHIRPAIPHKGESSDGQTLFNAIAVLVGIGLLSMPLAFSYAGWIAGTAMLIGFSFITCHTAKLLSKIIFADPTLVGYTDIGRKAFGGWAGGAINVLFCLELFAIGVALIVLLGDSLNAIFPHISADTFKVMGFFLILPTTFMPLYILSIPSVLSTFATVLLIGIVVFDGLYKAEAPGSLRQPMPTSWGPEMTGMNWLGGVGLVLAGYGGHAVIPSIAKDMRNPESVDWVYNVAFTVAGTVAFIAGAAGYLMIGDKVSDEITRDLMNPIYGYPAVLNLFAVWMIVVNPLTKFGLCSRPLNIAVEGFLGLAPAPVLAAPPPAPTPTAVTTAPRRPRAHSISVAALGSAISRRLSIAGVSDYITETDDSAVSTGIPKSPAFPPRVAAKNLDADELAKESRKGFLRIVSRTVITIACTATAVFLPGFEKVMAFLGSFSSFLICIILPLGFYLRLAPRLLKEGEETWRDKAGRWMHIGVMLVSTVFMGLGTVWALLPNSGRG